MTKAMIVTVGGTTEPIVKSISEYGPEFISFLASQDTCHKIAEIRAELEKTDLHPKSEISLADDVNDLLHCYEKAEEAVERVLRKGYIKDEVIVDYTGGTKNMSVALALASIVHGFSFSYVGGIERTKDGVGIVVTGKEKVYSSVNPWDFLAIEDRRKVSALFNGYQFKAAKEIIDSLAEKTTKYRAVFKQLGFIVNGYHKWDLFSHQEALESFKRAKLEVIAETEDKSIKAFAKATIEIIALLEKLVDCNRKPSLLFIHDMFANAERRLQEGKIDDAILRLYRLVEMVAQERLLTRHEIDVSDVKEEKIPDKFRSEYIKEYRSPRDKKIKIPQTAAFRLLEALGDETGITYRSHEKRFQDIQSARNYSYLAHGFDHSKEATYKGFKDFVLDLGMIKIEQATVFPKIEG